MPDLARRYGIVENTIYRWESTFGGSEISEAQACQAKGLPGQGADAGFDSVDGCEYCSFRMRTGSPRALAEPL